jgi:hypothetical protein
MNDPNYSIELFRTASFMAPRFEIYWMDTGSEWQEMCLINAIIRGGGKTVLVNTGLPKDFSEINGYWKSWDSRATATVKEGEHIVDCLKSFEATPEQIDLVLLTPLTTYTTGNLHLFTAANYAMSRTGWVDFQTPDPYSHQLPRPIVMPTRVHEYLTTSGWPRLRLLGDDEEVIPGIRGHWVGTHHRSSMAYVVNTSRGRVALTDCVFKYPNLEERRPLGIQESMAECLRSYDWLRKEVDIVIPLYDPEVFDRFPGGRVA